MRFLKFQFLVLKPETMAVWCQLDDSFGCCKSRRNRIAFEPVFMTEPRLVDSDNPAEAYLKSFPKSPNT